MINRSVLPEDCLGCGVCANVCPHSAISLDANIKGFKAPEVNIGKCTDCGACIDYCPALKPQKSFNACEEKKVYLAWSLDKGVRAESSSGGIFTELARYIFGLGGWVAGAAFTQDYSVEHVLADREYALAPMRLSKYTQSDTSAIYKKLKARLDSGKKMLFTGTPCQCASVSAYLKKDYSNLFLCDIICRGVNSETAFKEYLKWLGDKYKSNISKIRIRDKTNGWHNWGVRISFENGSEYYAPHKSDPFMSGFLSGLFLRDCCTRCRYKLGNRYADVTLGDFWGIDLSDADQVEKGVSALILHNEKGNSLFRNICDNIYSEIRALSDVVRKNPMLVEAAKNVEAKSALLLELGNTEFDVLVNKYRE